MLISQFLSKIPNQFPVARQSIKITEIARQHDYVMEYALICQSCRCDKRTYHFDRTLHGCRAQTWRKCRHWESRMACSSLVRCWQRPFASFRPEKRTCRRRCPRRPFGIPGTCPRSICGLGSLVPRRSRGCPRRMVSSLASLSRSNGGRSSACGWTYSCSVSLVQGLASGHIAHDCRSGMR